jgi:hypothetical protein
MQLLKKILSSPSVHMAAIGLTVALGEVISEHLSGERERRGVRDVGADGPSHGAPNTEPLTVLEARRRAGGRHG